jgi:hypothetical protein
MHIYNMSVPVSVWTLERDLCPALLLAASTLLALALAPEPSGFTRHYCYDVHGTRMELNS